MMSLDPLNILNTLNPCPLAGVADCELRALFPRPEIAVPIKNKRAAVLPSPEGLQYFAPVVLHAVPWFNAEESVGPEMT